MKKIWLTTEEASTYLGVSPETLRKWLRRGTLPVRTRKIGRQWRVNAHDLKSLSANWIS